MTAQRGYQFGYSSLHPEVTDPVTRERKARTAIVVLENHFGGPLSGRRVLDAGGSSGVMAACLAGNGCEVTAIDIDEAAILEARREYRSSGVTFEVGDAMALGFTDASVDIVLCCHVYEHVPDANRMMDEIYRVLRPGGVCYFAAGNRFAWMEPHYHLPLLSAIPRPLAHTYLRLAGRGEYYHERHLSYRGLRRLAGDFLIHDYTGRIIRQPTQFRVEYMMAPGSTKQRIARSVYQWLPGICPGYIWLLERPV